MTHPNLFGPTGKITQSSNIARMTPDGRMSGTPQIGIGEQRDLGESHVTDGLTDDSGTDDHLSTDDTSRD